MADTYLTRGEEQAQACEGGKEGLSTASGDMSSGGGARAVRWQPGGKERGGPKGSASVMGYMEAGPWRGRPYIFITDVWGDESYNEMATGVIVFQMGRARLLARGTGLKSTTLART
jgi:hypothetical protein